MKIAILGAECTGKTSLARALVQRAIALGTDAIWVPEYLRQWCDLHRRTPRADEQRHIAQTQDQQVRAQSASLVLADTAPLMTAVYSEIIFNDPSLLPFALECHRVFDLTLVTGLDVAWVGDGIQRDGESMRKRVNQRLRELLAQHRIPFSMVYGLGEQRTACALQALDYARGAARPQGPRSNWKWNCEKCSDADCEHRMFSALLAP